MGMIILLTYMIKNKKNNMAQSFNINNTSFTGNLSQWAMTGMTWGSEPGSDEENGKGKKENNGKKGEKGNKGKKK